MPAVKPSIALEMQFSGSAGAWTAVSSDVLVRPGVRASYGIRDNGPIDRVASTGTMDFSLRNDAGNSGGKEGYYSPNHSNVRSGFDIGIGARLLITYSGSTFYKWRGRLSSISPEAGRFGPHESRCQAVDWFEYAARRKMRQLAVAFDQRADQGIATILGSMNDLPAASSLAIGQDTFPTVFDSTRDESTSVLRELNKLVQSEQGYLYTVGDQVTGEALTFEDRHTRPKYGTSSASFNDTMVVLRPDRSARNIFNVVKGQAFPRETSVAASVLFTLQSTPLVAQSASVVLEGRYTDPSQRGAIRVGGASMISPCSGTDFTMNSASDGSGTNLTSSFTVAASYGGNSVRYAIFNGGTQSGYITLLQARGRVIAVKEPTLTEKLDQTSIDNYGEYYLSLDMPYQEDPLVLEDAANAALSNWKDPTTMIEGVEFVANISDELMQQALFREPGDKITITETVSGIDREYFINGASLTVGALDELRVAWVLAPAETINYWILGLVGSSELGVTTVLGY